MEDVNDQSINIILFRHVVKYMYNDVSFVKHSTCRFYVEIIIFVFFSLPNSPLNRKSVLLTYKYCPARSYDHCKTVYSNSGDRKIRFGVRFHFTNTHAAFLCEYRCDRARQNVVGRTGETNRDELLAGLIYRCPNRV